MVGRCGSRCTYRSEAVATSPRTASRSIGHQLLAGRLCLNPWIGIILVAVIVHLIRRMWHDDNRTRDTTDVITGIIENTLSTTTRASCLFAKPVACRLILLIFLERQPTKSYRSTCEVYYYCRQKSIAVAGATTTAKSLWCMALSPHTSGPLHCTGEPITLPCPRPQATTTTNLGQMPQCRKKSVTLSLCATRLCGCVNPTLLGSWSWSEHRFLSPW